MIDGFRIDVPSGEMKAFLEKRAEAHREQADKSEAKAREYLIKSGGRSPPGTIEHGTVEMIEQTAAFYRSAAERYDFLAAHVIAGETYRLSVSDLTIAPLGGIAGLGVGA